MTTIQNELEELKSQTETADSEQKARSEALEALRTRIKNGESTGDRLRDLAIIIQGDDEKLLKVFQELEAQMAGKTGQLFMLAEYEERKSPHHGDFYQLPPDIRLETVTLGILADDKLVIDITKATWKIPCHEFTNGVLKKTGPAGFEDEYAPLNYLLHHWGRSGLTGHPVPKLAFGDEEVFQLFHKEAHRFADETVARRDLVRKTYQLTLPDGHRLHQGRVDWREHNFSEALALEEKILRLRFLIENIQGDDPRTDYSGTIREIRNSVRELKTRIELAVALGIDPNRSEVLRIKQNFGHYWA